MKTWIVRSGDEQWVAQGEKAFEAAVAALKRRPPTTPIGTIMTVREPHVEDMTEECWLLSTVSVAEAAGLEWRRRSEVSASDAH